VNIDFYFKNIIDVISLTSNNISPKFLRRVSSNSNSMALQLFAYKMVHLSRKSSAAVKEADDCGEIETEEDHVRLWNRVRASHCCGTAFAT
jgi:hypothetical protein